MVPTVESGNPPSSVEVNEEVAWALLRSKLGVSHPASGPVSGSGGSSMDAPIVELLKAIGTTTSSASSVPASVLAIAPHLAKLTKAESLDKHLHKTWELRQVFSSEKAVEPIIDLMQCQHLQESIPRSIWRKIVRDEYVGFERLSGSTDRNYSHKDDHKEFAGGFVLANKEQIYN